MFSTVIIKKFEEFTICLSICWKEQQYWVLMFCNCNDTILLICISCVDIEYEILDGLFTELIYANEAPILCVIFANNGADDQYYLLGDYLTITPLF